MTNHKSPSVGVVVITHKARHHLPHCLPPLLQSAIHPRILVVNSSSNDGTVPLAEKLGAEVLVIPRSEFNHGATRERARRYLATDIVVMITPDAYPTGPEMLERLAQPIIDEKASIAYARQLPHHNANIFESFSREFNYPTTSHIRSIKDASKYGAYTFFCSDSCAAYRNAALDEIGGFPAVLLGEDTFVVAQLLHRGHQIAYVADACVQHSHRYTLMQEFQHYFDTGLVRKQYETLLRIGGADEKRGTTYARALIHRIAKEKPLLLPYSFFHLAAKFLGYRIGRLCVGAPLFLKKVFSQQDFYWTSKETHENRSHRIR